MQLTSYSLREMKLPYVVLSVKKVHSNDFCKPQGNNPTGQYALAYSLHNYVLTPN